MDDVMIRVDAELLLSEAGVVLDKAARIEGYFQEIKEAVERSKGYWQGEAAEAHRRAYRQYTDEIEGILGRYRENAASLDEIGRRYADTDKQAEEAVVDLPSDVIF